MNPTIALRAATRHARERKQRRFEQYCQRIIEQAKHDYLTPIGEGPQMIVKITTPTHWQRFKSRMRAVWEAFKDYCDTPPGCN